MKRFYVLCGGIAAVLAGITYFFQTEATIFYGIADTKETIINAVEGVEIEKLFVVSGQTVNTGDTLVKLDQPELKIRVNEISHTLNEYKAQLKFQNTFSRSELRKYQAEQEERINEITAEIKELEAQYEMNKKLVRELRSFQVEQKTDDDSANPILTQIKSLKKLLESAKNPAEVEIQRIQKQLMSDNEDPITPQVERLTEELALLQKEQQKLVICAQINGMIGTVKFKEGEKVSPFDTILTLHAAAPSYIKGFIHENVYSQVSVNDEVIVKSVSDERYHVTGKVIGVGSRIVDYPERLRKRADIPVWGRELLIKIPENNNFLLGEKVLISVGKKKNKLSIFKNVTDTKIVPDIHASTETGDQPYARPAELKTFTYALGVSSLPVEASGIQYLGDKKSYAVISDDTENKLPFLFLMDADAIIQKQTLIENLPKINDMEAISTDAGGNFYVLASQSFNKKGEQAPIRKLLTRVKKTADFSFALDKQVVLFDILTSAANENNGDEWAKFITMAASGKDVDIEGMCFNKDTLLLGFKNPKLLNKAVILGITDIDAVFEKQKISSKQVFIWRQIHIEDTRTGTVCGISDLAFKNDTLFGVSTGVQTRSGIEEDIGLFWKYTKETQELNVIRSFSGLKPEGLTYNSDSNEFYIVFDNGSKNPSQLLVVKG